MLNDWVDVCEDFPQLEKGMTNASRTVKVMLSDGKVVEIYKSVTDCANKNHFCKSTIASRCRGQFNTIFASDGYAYCYEDDNKQLQKIRKELREQYGKDKQGRRS